MGASHLPLRSRRDAKSACRTFAARDDSDAQWHPGLLDSSLDSHAHMDVVEKSVITFDVLTGAGRVCVCVGGVRLLLLACIDRYCISR